MDVKSASGTIGVVGTGVIGAGWAAYFLAKGFDVAASDPAEGAETRLRTFVDTAWPTLEQLGLADGASRSRLRFDPDIARACADCVFIQESGPERADLKRDLLAKISAAAPRTILIATSSSGILISDIQDAAVCPERVVVGHPFNPSHLMPLVEVVAGRLTSDEWLARALQFYGAIGKKPVHIRGEVKGHVANRLQRRCGVRPSTWCSKVSFRWEISTRSSRTAWACDGLSLVRLSICTCRVALAALVTCWNTSAHPWRPGGAIWEMFR
jgi:carnitine 3-dehydrogenase